MPPQTAGVTKDGAAVAGDRLAELDALPHRLVAPREQPRQALPARFPGFATCVRQPPSRASRLFDRVGSHQARKNTVAPICSDAPPCLVVALSSQPQALSPKRGFPLALRSLADHSPQVSH
jgi:hypothetical protein